jgi:hypothetical protein
MSDTDNTPTLERRHIESSDSIDTILNRSKNANYGVSLAFKRLDGGATLIAPSRSAWQGRERAILPPDERAQGAVAFVEARCVQRAKRELEQARRAAEQRKAMG